MKRTTNILYWIFTVIFALMLFMDGIGGVTQQEAGKEVMAHLEYPMYFLIIVGVAKLLASIAILQNKFKTVKEWAFAGVAFTFIGAFASRAFMGDAALEIIFPIIMLGFMCIPYFLWKKKEQAS